MISLKLENKNERMSAAISVGVHVLILLIAIFFYKCYTVPNPPPETTQGIDIAFGDVVVNQGETENPFDAAPEQATSAAQPEVEELVEEVTEPVDQPLESEHLVEETEVTEPETVVEEVIPETETTVTETSVETEVETESKNTENTEATEETESESKPELGGLGGLGNLPGGPGEQSGTVGDPNATEKTKLPGGTEVTMSKGWGIATEPKPAVKEAGEVTISVEFNRSGQVIPGSVKFVKGNLNLFNANKDVITKSLEEELKFTQTDTSQAPKSRNKATFRFEFRGH